MYLGIALMFGSMGPMIGLLQTPASGWAMAVVLMALAGALATGWAFMFQRRGWWFLLLVPLILFPIFGIPPIMRLIWEWPVMRLGHGMSEIARRVVLLVMAMSGVSLGFTLIVRYIARVERAGARARAELGLAAQIHASLVPAVDVAWGRVRVVGTSEASGAMGGDLIDVIAAEDRLDVFLADVSGHGVRAGVVMGMLKAMLRTAMREGGDPSSHMATVNGVLADLTEPSMFATAVWVRLERGDGVVRGSVVVAGHPPVLRLDARGGAWGQIGGESLPLGVLAGETFVATPVELGDGDALVLYTDGLTEAADGRGRQLGIDGLAGLVGRVPLADPERARAELLRAVRAGRRSEDDQTLVVVRVG